MENSNSKREELLQKIKEFRLLDDDFPIGKLMHDFSCKNPSDMYYKPLAEQVRYYKEDEK